MPGKRLPSEVEWEAASRAGAIAFVPKTPEWCADCWDDEFLRWANRKNPLNRWGSASGPHVIRRPGRASGQRNANTAGFRCVQEAVLEEAR